MLSRGRCCAHSHHWKFVFFAGFKQVEEAQRKAQLAAEAQAAAANPGPRPPPALAGQRRKQVRGAGAGCIASQPCRLHA